MILLVPQLLSPWALLFPGSTPLYSSAFCSHEYTIDLVIIWTVSLPYSMFPASHSLITTYLSIPLLPVSSLQPTFKSIPDLNSINDSNDSFLLIHLDSLPFSFSLVLWPVIITPPLHISMASWPLFSFIIGKNTALNQKQLLNPCLQPCISTWLKKSIKLW